MVADCLDIDGVKSSPVHEVRFTKSGSFSLGAVIQTWVPSMHQGIQLAVKTLLSFNDVDCRASCTKKGVTVERQFFFFNPVDKNL